MNSVYSWIYVDNANNIWKFFLNDKNELCYNIMYGEEKWTKEKVIDKFVVSFAVQVAEEETIHIIYSNISVMIKYCTLKDRQWIGRSLYKIEIENSEVHDLTIDIVGSEMHIFYLLIEKDNSSHGVIIHSIWDGKEMKTDALQNIIMNSNIKKNYQVKVDNNTIVLIFVTDQGDEFSLIYCYFENHKWTLNKRLYGIQGDNISFEILKDQQKIHILNKCKEDSTYYLDHVCVDIDGSVQEYKVHKSKKELLEPILFMTDNKVYTCWIEENKIFYSEFHSNKWDTPIYFNRKDQQKLIRYHYMNVEKSITIEKKAIYGTNSFDIHLFDPNQFLPEKNDSLEVGIKQKSVSEEQDESMLQRLKLDLSKVKSENKGLEKTIASLNMQLQKNKRVMDEYEERIAKVIEQKHKADENCKLFMELQKDILKELEEAKLQLINERNFNVTIESKLKECEEENRVFGEQIKKISEEKKDLNEILELEKNQSFIEKLFNGRTKGL